MSFTGDLEDILKNPRKYGAPTFAEFAQDPQKFMRMAEQSFVAVDKGATAFSHLVKTHRYFFRDAKGKRFKCKSLDAVYVVAHSEGVHPKDLEYDPQVVPTGDGQCEIHVTFYRKSLVQGLQMAR